MHPFPDETAHLAEILQKLDAALQEADADVERIDTDYKIPMKCFKTNCY